MKRIHIIDGQGGGIGRQLIEGARARGIGAEIIAAGTNSSATAAMVKAGAAQGATGENAVIVNARRADLIVGPAGIVIADAMLGEISPAMAAAVGQSEARKLLIPINLCNNIIVGTPSLPLRELIALAVEEMYAFCTQKAAGD